MRDAPSTKAGRQAGLLGWGFASSVVLVVLNALLSAWQVSQAGGELMELFRGSERSTYLIGHIEQQLSRMRLSLRDRATHGDAPGVDFRDVDATLQANLSELGSLLSPDQAQLWQALEPGIQRLRAELVAVGSAQQRGQSQRASAILDSLVPQESELMNSLASLYRMNREWTDAALGEADERLALLRTAEVAASAVLVIGIGTTWWIVIGLVRRQRAQLDQYIRRVESANADLNAFAGRTAHDLRDVLSPLSLAAATLKHAAGNAERLAAASERLERSASRAFSLLDALLTFSRAGQPSEGNESCSVRAELQAVVDELAPVAERISARVEIDVDAEADPKVKCSAGLMGIVLRNVLGNALKYLAGRPARLVRISVRTIAARWCEIAIADSGPGIPVDAIPRIFEPFYRVPGTRAPGTGIGLATVQRVVVAHGGEVFVRSKVGEGTRFEVRFPLAAGLMCSVHLAEQGVRPRSSA